MLLVFVSILTFLAFLSFFTTTLYSSMTRYTMILSLLSEAVASIITTVVGKIILSLLLTVLALSNALGNLPHSSVFTMFYSIVFTISFLLWIPLIISTLQSQAKDFIAHLLPEGSPYALFIILPLIELFSLIIRPLTLVIRLSTNLAAGHIMMYIFSYFTTLSTVMVPLLFTSLSLLFILEFFISLLQAYIFIALVQLYISESTS